MFLIDDLLFWLPAKGLLSVFRKIEERAVGEHKRILKEELLTAVNDLEAGRIGEKEYRAVEGEIIKKLEGYSKEK